MILHCFLATKYKSVYMRNFFAGCFVTRKAWKLWISLGSMSFTNVSENFDDLCNFIAIARIATKIILVWLHPSEMCHLEYSIDSIVTQSASECFISRRWANWIVFYSLALFHCIVNIVISGIERHLQQTIRNLETAPCCTTYYKAHFCVPFHHP